MRTLSLFFLGMLSGVSYAQNIDGSSKEILACLKALDGQLSREINVVKTSKGEQGYLLLEQNTKPPAKGEKVSIFIQGRFVTFKLPEPDQKDDLLKNQA